MLLFNQAFFLSFKNFVVISIHKSGDKLNVNKLQTDIVSKHNW